MKLYSLALVLVVSCSTFAQNKTDANFKIALPDHNGQLTWAAEGFKITQSSAKSDGREIGLRGQDNSAHLSFLGFLFLAPKGEVLTSAKCRDEALAEEKRNLPNLKILGTAELDKGNGIPVSLVTFSTPTRDGSTGYHVHGFVATNDICGDLEIYGPNQIRDTDPAIAKIFTTYHFDPDYKPDFADVVFYGQVLYDAKNFQAAAPVFERSLLMLPADGTPFPSVKVARRVLTDEAGMAYGISGNLAKARAIFTTGIAADPDYPLYYYNLACADAGDNKLADARLHLQQAFARKANLIPGEAMPDPTTDDSFVPYKGDREFWEFVERLPSNK
jgi:tetratricopeptide (TPR) repeat protein